MMSINEFEKKHQSLINRLAHSLDEALLLAALCVSYLSPFLERFVRADASAPDPDCLCEDLVRLNSIMNMVAIPNICPRCGLISDWRFNPSQTILDVSWIIAITRTRMGCDSAIGEALPVSVIKEAITVGCPIMVEFFCKGCCHKATGYIKLGKIELIPGDELESPL